MIKIETTPRFRRSVRRLSRPEIAAIEAALLAVAHAYGYPHLDSGLGIRHLRRHWFECRVVLDTRLVILAQKGLLTFHVAGHHDAVRRFLKVNA